MHCWSNVSCCEHFEVRKENCFFFRTCQREFVAEYDTKQPPAYVCAQKVFENQRVNSQCKTVNRRTASPNRGITVSASALQYNGAISYDQSDEMACTTLATTEANARRVSNSLAWSRQVKRFSARRRSGGGGLGFSAAASIARVGFGDNMLRGPSQPPLVHFVQHSA